MEAKVVTLLGLQPPTEAISLEELEFTGKQRLHLLSQLLEYPTSVLLRRGIVLKEEETQKQVAWIQNQQQDTTSHFALRLAFCQ